jgi:hypothetical protein
MNSIVTSNSNITDGSLNLNQIIKSYEILLEGNKDNPDFKKYKAMLISFKRHLEKDEEEYIESGIDFNMEVSDFIQLFQSKETKKSYIKWINDYRKYLSDNEILPLKITRKNVKIT